MDWNDPKILEARRAGEERSRKARWAARGRARVIHPLHGETVVPCSGTLAAIMCAAEVWGCEWSDILTAEVMSVE